MEIHKVEGRVVVDGVAGETIPNGDALQVDRFIHRDLSSQSRHINAGITLACVLQ